MPITVPGEGGFDPFAGVVAEEQEAAAPVPEPAPTPQVAEPAPEPFDPFAPLEAANERLGVILRTALATDADRAAGIEQIARETGMDREFVGNNYDGMKNLAEQAKLDPVRLRETDPLLVEMLERHPEAAPVVIREQSLGPLARVMGWMGSFTEMQLKYPLMGVRSNIVRGLSTPGAVGLGALEPTYEKPKERVPQSVEMVVDPVAEEDGFLQPFRQFGASWRQGRASVELSQTGAEIIAAKLAGRDTRALEQRALTLKEESRPRFYGQDGALGSLAVELGETLPSSWENLSNAGPAGAAAGLATAAAGTALKAPAVTKQAPRVAGLVGKGASAWSTFRLEMGGAYLDIRDQRTERGEPVSDDIALGASVIYGLAAAGVEVGAMGPALRAFGPLGDAVAGGTGRKAMRDLLAKPGTRAMLADLGRRWLASANAEGLEEAGQQTLQSMAAWVARTAQDEAPQALDLHGAMTEAGSAYETGFRVAAASSAPGAAVNVSSRIVGSRMSEDRALESGAKVAKIAEVAKTKAAQAAPAAVADLIESASAKTGEPITSLFIDGERFMQEAQSAGLEPVDVARELMGDTGPQRLEQAATTGGRIEVPVAEYLERWGASPLAERLALDTATEAGGQTVREVQARREQETADTQQMADTFYQQNNVLGPEVSEAERRMVDAVQGQLAGTNVYSPEDSKRAVAFIRAFLRTQAVAFGVSPDVLFSDHALRVQRASGAESGGALEQAAAESGSRAPQTETDAFRGWFGGSKIVDGEGKPLLVFHGTNAEDFDAFRPGAYFTPDETYSYITNSDRVVPVYLSIRNPYRPASKQEIESLRSFPERIAELEAQGYDGMIWSRPDNIYRGASGWGDDKSQIVAFRPEQIKSAIGNRGTFDPANPSILFSEGKDGPRGFIQTGRNAAGGRDSTINLTPNADLSTFLHETGHWFLETFGDLTEREDAPQQVKDDYAALLKWFGVTDRAGIQREHHEKFARGFERYLMEGKAPSADLARVFERVRIWLGKVYRQLSGLDVELSDEVRGVFDRMLATDEEIASARRKAGAAPVDVSALGLTDEQRREYEDIVTAADRAARQRAEEIELRDRARELEDWWLAEEKAEREAAATEYDTLPATLAVQFLRENKLGGQPVEPVKINRAQAEAAVGKMQAKKLAGLLAKKGENIDDVAASIGWASGKEMLAAVVKHPDRETWAKAKAKERMREKHTDEAARRAELAERIKAAQHGAQGLSEQYQRELAFLKAGSRSRIPSVEATRAAAQQLAGQTAVGKIAPQRVLAAERRAGEQFAAAMAKGKREEALTAKHRQLLNHFLYRELVKAEKAVARFERTSGRLASDTWRQKVGVASAPIRAASDGLLAALGVREQREGEPAFLGVGSVVALLEEANVGVAFDADRLAGIVAKTEANGWQSLTVEELSEAETALNQIHHTGNVLSGVQVQDRRRSFAELAAAIDSEASARPDLGLSPRDERKNKRERMKRRIKLMRQGLIASYTDPEEIFRRLGPTAHRAFWQRFIAGQEVEQRLAGDVLAKLVKLWDEKMPKGVREILDVEIDASALPLVDGKTRRDDGKVSHRYLIMIALNVGNAGNKQRLLDGYGWTAEQVQDFLDQHMTEAEWDFVQGIWDLMEGLRPEMERVFEAVNGTPPGRVQAVPITTASGRTLRGGYFPARYDPQGNKAQWVAEKQGDQGIQDARASAKATVTKSFTKGRVEEFAAPIMLDWQTVPGHVTQVIHYVAQEQFVRDANRMLANTQFLGTVERRLGKPYIEQIREWVKYVATARDGATSEAALSMDRVLNWSRSRTTMGALGYSVASFAPDILNLSVAVTAGDVKASAVGRAMRRALSEGGIGKMHEEAKERSHEVRKRDAKATDLLREQFSEIGEPGESGPLGWVRENAFAGQAYMDRIVTTILWHAAREQALTEELTRAAQKDESAEAGIKDEPGRYDQVAAETETDAAEDEMQQAAIAHADTILAGMQPATDKAEQGGLMRSARVGQLLIMFGYFNKLGNIVLRLWDRTETGGDRAVAAGKIFAILAVSNVLGSLIAGQGPEDDEEAWEWVLRKTVSAPVTLVPLVGGWAEDGVNKAISLAIHGEIRERKYSMRAAPGLAAFERIGGALEKAIKAEDPVSATKAVAQAAGFAFRVPVTQPNKSLGYVLDLATGSRSPSDPFDLASGLLHGERDAFQTANPWSIASDLVHGE